MRDFARSGFLLVVSSDGPPKTLSSDSWYSRCGAGPWIEIFLLGGGALAESSSARRLGAGEKVAEKGLMKAGLCASRVEGWDGVWECCSFDVEAAGVCRGDSTASEA